MMWRSDRVEFVSLSLTESLGCCFLLGVILVLGLYAWRTGLPRDHPTTVKRRIVSVLFVCSLSPIILSFFSSSSDGDLGQPLSAWLGLRTSNFLQAAVFPVILTMILFSGPIIMYVIEWKATTYIDTGNDKLAASQMLWLRNYLVAPFAEEFAFRACMLPVLWPHFQLTGSVIVCPLFFGVAHIHHVIERFSMSDGTPAVYIWMEALFQLTYTSVFGAYTSYIFLRTGHLIGPVLCHAFCNFMGFPDFTSVLQFSMWKAALLSSAFIGGLIGFLLLLQPLTDPSIYGNAIYIT